MRYNGGSIPSSPLQYPIMVILRVVAFLSLVAFCLIGRVESSDDVKPAKGVEERKSSDASRAKGEINFDDLKFEIEKDAKFRDEMLADADVKKLVGKKVKLRGYILPATLFKETDIDQFVLVRDNQECCFGPGAALFDCVIIEMVPGKTTDFVTRPVTVEGKFKIDTKSYRYPGGVGPKGATHFAIFQIAGESVK
ncbi:MAG: DUF3299 domain-containing protein [Rubripirellula sp.]